MVQLKRRDFMYAYEKFEDFSENSTSENVEQNASSRKKFKQFKDVNKNIMNRQLNIDLNEQSSVTENFDTVQDALDGIDDFVQYNDDIDAGVEISERSSSSERVRLYGYTIIAILTLTGGLIITSS
jgi:cell fate (sporulation/competence/biofilm development) regulator YlbF (YheA/YmcA/DUF963 family)